LDFLVTNEAHEEEQPSNGLLEAVEGALADLEAVEGALADADDRLLPATEIKQRTDQASNDTRKGGRHTYRCR
jgi:hypothetical protein